MPTKSISKSFFRAFPDVKADKLQSLLAREAQGKLSESEIEFLSASRDSYSDFPAAIPRPPSVVPQEEAVGLPGRIALGAEEMLARQGPAFAGAATGAGLGAAGGPPGIAAGALIGGMGGEAFRQLGHRALGFGGPETSEEAATEIAGAGTAGLLQEAGPLVRTAIAPGAVAAEKIGALLSRQGVTASSARRLGIDFTPAQARQGTIITAVDNIVRRSIGGAQVFRRFDQRVNQQLIKAADDVAEEINRQGMSQQEAGAFVKAALDKADEAFRASNEEAYGQLRNVVGDIPLPKKNLQKVAKELLEDLEDPLKFAQSLKSQENIKKATDVLEDFVRGGTPRQLTREAPQAIPRNELFTTLEAFGKAETSEPLTFSRAQRLRSLLMTLTREKEITIGRGAVKRLTGELDAAMESGLRQAGREDALKLFRDTNARFKSTRELFETRLIAKLRETDNPELIAEALLAKGAETNIKNLRRLIGEPNMHRVERALWEKIIDRARQRNVDGVSEGALVGDKLLSQLDNLTNDTIEAIWGNRPQVLQKIREFVDVANTVGLRSSITGSLSRTDTSLLALGQSGATIALIAGDFTLTGTGIVLTPFLLAKIMTSETAIELATKGMTTPAASSAGKEITKKILIYLGVKKTLAPRREERKSNASSLRPTNREDRQ